MNMNGGMPAQSILLCGCAIIKLIVAHLSCVHAHCELTEKLSDIFTAM